MVVLPPTGDAGGHAGLGKQMLSRPHCKTASTALQQASTAADTDTGTDSDSDSDTDTNTEYRHRHRNTDTDT